MSLEAGTSKLGTGLVSGTSQLETGLPTPEERYLMEKISVGQNSFSDVEEQYTAGDFEGTLLQLIRDGRVKVLPMAERVHIQLVDT